MTPPRNSLSLELAQWPSAMSGNELLRAREAKALTIDAVARQLLMSKRQVCGLESGDASAFHNTAFYERAREKYAAFVGVAPPLVVPAPGDNWRHPAAAVPLRMTSAATPAGPHNNPRHSRTGVAVAIALGAFIVLGIYFVWSA